nr:ABC transporter ATP-binding protein [Actinomycetota bacterium]
LYRRPDVLVLDEGTSALDNETEAELLAALERLRGERTVIAVAHRLTSVEKAEKVVIVGEGRIVDVGTYAQLADRHTALRT